MRFLGLALGAALLAGSSAAHAQVTFGYHNSRTRIPIHNYHARSRTSECGWDYRYAYGRRYRQYICLDDAGNRYPVDMPTGETRVPVHNYHNITRDAPEDVTRRDESRSTARSQLTLMKTKLDQSLDKLVSADSRSWLANRYDEGSMHDGEIVEQSTKNSKYTVRGDYTYNSGRPGWVKIRFEGNKPTCIEFWDFAGQCRALGHSPSRDIAATLVLAAALGAMASSSGGGSGDYHDARDRQNADQANYMAWRNNREEIQRQMSLSDPNR
jgi:hypothetical protein